MWEVSEILKVEKKVYGQWKKSKDTCGCQNKLGWGKFFEAEHFTWFLENAHNMVKSISFNFKVSTYLI